MKPQANTRGPFPESIHQEIIVFTQSQFSGRCTSLVGKEEDPAGPGGPDRLEEVCWAGLLPEFLPELAWHGGGTGLFIWHIWPGEHFLWISQGTRPVFPEPENSIDPYCFIPAHSCN